MTFRNKRGTKFVQNVTFNEIGGLKNKLNELETENRKLNVKSANCC